MEKRAFLAIMICLTILIGWQFLFLKKKEPVSPTDIRKEVKETIKNKMEDKKIVSQSQSVSVQEKEIVVEMELYRAVFSTHGGALKSWKLKKYKDKTGEGAQGIEMVTQTNPNSYPLSLSFSQERFQYLTQASYGIEEHEPTALIFSYRDNKVKVERVYQFSPNTYQIEHTTKIWMKDGIPKGDIFIGFSEGFPVDSTSGILAAPYREARNFIYHFQNKTSRKNITSVKQEEEIKSVMNWMGIENQYFISSLVNKSEMKPYLLMSAPIQGYGNVVFQYPFHPAANRQHFEINLTSYIGPKDISLLKEVGAGLESAVDYGWLSFICIPLLGIMNFFYHYVIHNYGVAILLLTLLVRIVFHPLTKKSYVSMREMQRVQPQMAKIKEKFKDNKEQMNKAIMDLMRSNKVNPLGGCLPLLIQMPIFFALYRVFYNAIELYQAPFFGWIQDLSAKDPYYITPILMGGAMFIQQKMTPSTTMDPAQQKMMLFMPIIFSFFMIALPSGLVIYILFSTLLQVASQYLVNQEFIKKGL